VTLIGVEMLFFLPLAWGVYWMLPRGAAIQNAWLLLASMVFYASWGPQILPLFLAWASIDYSVGSALAWEHRPEKRRGLLGISIASNIGFLTFFKYVGFFAESLNALFWNMGVPASVPVLRMLLPLGLSYIALLKLGYVIDVYYRRIEPCRSALTFATFVCFFPQLMAGPIPRARQLLPQFSQPRILLPEMAASGALTFLLGFAMKAFVANWIGPNIVDPVFANSAHFNRATHMWAVFGYAIQVFCDFAGYSLLAIGTGRLFGIELPENFRRPFLARSLPEFWQRWHITLNTWLFDYIYSPITTSHSFMRGRYALGFILVFLVSGIWHGAQWGFVLWGLMHGFGLVVHFYWDKLWKILCRWDRAWVARRRSRPYQAAAWLVTQGFFLLSLIPFRGQTATGAFRFFDEMMHGTGTGTIRFASVTEDVTLVLILAFFLAYHAAVLPAGKNAWERFSRLPAPVRGLSYGLAAVLLALFTPVGVGTFIYAQF
jgi:D-alanyl-lipoteichoic acid acyltransferase DltB (MBOAT superfamily)